MPLMIKNVYTILIRQNILNTVIRISQMIKELLHNYTNTKLSLKDSNK